MELSEKEKMKKIRRFAKEIVVVVKRAFVKLLTCMENLDKKLELALNFIRRLTFKFLISDNYRNN